MRTPTLRRTLVVGVVVAVHLLLAQLFIATTAPRAVPAIGEALSAFILVPTRRAAPPPAAPPPKPEPAAVPAPTVTPDLDGKRAAFIAADTTAPVAAGDVPTVAPEVIDDLGFDARALGDACMHEYPETAIDLQRRATLILLVKVEASGRPSEIKIVASSGPAELDSAVSACVMSLGAFASTLIDGQRIPAWHRLQWIR